MASSKKNETYPSYDVTHKKTQIQKFPIFKIKTTRLSASLEDLNSSLAQSPGEFWWHKSLKKWHNWDLQG